MTRAWWRVAAVLFAVAWGGNEFTPLLVLYRTRSHLGMLTVDVLLAAYVLGIVPGLLVGGPLSDRFGRRPLMLPAPVLGAIGSAVLAAGAHSPALLFIGRVCSGIALGLVMAVGTSWVKELSSPAYEPGVDAGAGARRASLALTTGFGLGAAVAAALAQWGPWPAQTPYLVNVAITLGALVAVLGVTETRPRSAQPGRLVDDLRIPAAGHRRFLRVVAPTAPWVFGTAASAYAILPSLLAAQVPGLAVGLAGLMCLVALGCGVVVQLAGRRLDCPDDARGLGVGMLAAVPGLVLAAATATTGSVTLGLAAAAVLGCSYGLLLVGGLQEVQRIAGPDDLAGLTAVYYSVAYLGFFVPAVLAGLHGAVGYPAMFVVGAVLAAACLGVVLLGWRRHLPASAGPAGPAGPRPGRSHDEAPVPVSSGPARSAAS